MKEEYKAYRVSILVGIIAGVVVGFLLYNFMILSKHMFMLVAGIVPSTSVILLSSILSGKFSITWKRIRTRFYCIILLLGVYMYFHLCFFGIIVTVEDIFQGAYVEGVGAALASFFKGLLWLLLTPFYLGFFFPTLIAMEPIGFLYSNLLTIPAAYVATRRIENLPKRIILAFLFAILICLIASLPIITVMLGG